MRLAKTIRIAALLCAALIANPSAAQTARDEDGKARVAKAEAMFHERCKKSGEFIHRTVENVEGILLMKLRPAEINYGHNVEQQFRLDDPYGRDLGGEGYLESLVRGEFWATHTGTPMPGSPPRVGYPYVEAIDPKDGKRYRYIGSVKPIGKKDSTAYNVQVELKRNPNYDLNIYAFVLDKFLATAAPPRYGVTYDDISTHEEREYWIAGSSLKVIDLKTKEVMAERIGYMWDPGQGNNSGGRSPWLLAADHACPAFSVRNGASAQRYQTLDFVEKVLTPILEKK